MLTISFSLPLKSQDKQSELIKGVKVAELLKAGDKHKYRVKLEKDQFAFFRLTQKGVDALITPLILMAKRFRILTVQTEEKEMSLSLCSQTKKELFP